MPTFARALLAAAVVIGLVAGGALFLQRSNQVFVGGPSPSTTNSTPAAPPSASPAPGSLGTIDLSGTFVSNRYGYMLPIGADWAASQAAITWSGPDNSRPVVDEFSVIGSPWLRGSGASQALAPGQTFDEWIDLFQSPENAASPCYGGPESAWPTRRLGGRDWRWVEGCESYVAITEVAGRVYVFTFGGPGKPPDDAVQLFERMLASVELDPGSAPLPPDAPALDGRFQSNRHGFILRYPADWTVEQRSTTSAPDDRMPEPPDPSLDVLGNADLRLSISSRALPNGQSATAWARAFCDFTKTAWSPACDQTPGVWKRAPLAEGQAWVAVDGDTAATFPANDHRLFAATAVKDGRAYEIRLDGNAEESLFLAIVASMQLDPTAAIESPPQP